MVNLLYLCMYVSVCVVICCPRVHHAAHMRNAQSITSTLNYSKQRTSRNPSTAAAIKKRLRSSMEGNRNSRREKKEIRKVKADQGIGNTGGCLSVLDAAQQPTA